MRSCLAARIASCRSGPMAPRGATTRSRSPSALTSMPRSRSVLSRSRAWVPTAPYRSDRFWLLQAQLLGWPASPTPRCDRAVQAQQTEAIAEPLTGLGDRLAEVAADQRYRE